MRIAVGTDFSDRARETFPIACALAKELSAELLVVHQVQLSTLIHPAPVSAEVIYGAAETHLADLLEKDKVFEGLSPRPLVLRGGNLRTFGEFLEEHDVDLLVVASHGRTGVRRFLIGSFAERALRFSPCPVFIHRRAEHDTPETPRFPPRRVLITHDLSEFSQQSVHSACEWVRRFGASARLLHVVSFEAGATGFGPDLLGAWHQYREKMEEVAREELAKIVADRLQETESDFTVRHGHPVLEILSEAEEINADLIALGTHGRSGMEHVLLGSVAEKVARKAPCSVLAIKGFGRDES